MKIPAIGLVVHVFDKSRPDQFHPAMITRVWSPAVVNATIFPDGGHPFPCQSLPLFQSEEIANSYGYDLCAFWPSEIELAPERDVVFSDSPADVIRRHITGIDGRFLFSEDEAVLVEESYLQEHKPAIGGTYIELADGTQSYEPAAAVSNKAA